MDPDGSTLLLIIIATLAFSALFSGSETAFFSLTSYRLREMREDDDPKANRIAALMVFPDRLLSSILLGNTAVNTIFTSALALAVLDITEGYVSQDVASMIASALATLLLLTFGEVTPKAWATNNPEKFAYFAINKIRIINLLLTPFTFVINILTGVILGFKKDEDAKDLITEEIIKTAVAVGEESGAVEEDEKEIIYNIFKSTDALVSDIMVPRSAVTTVNEIDSLRQAAKVFSEEGYSRLPVLSSSGEKEFFCGILYAKDLLEYFRDKEFDYPVTRAMRAASYCRPNQKAVEMLVQMRESGRHMSVVSEPNGTILGLITLEDILEEIFGSIVDEHDIDEIVETWQGGVGK